MNISLPKQADIVFPKGNEDELLAAGRRLGCQQLLFAYEGGKGAKGREGVTTIAVAREKEQGRRQGMTIVRVAEDPRFVVEHQRPTIAYGFESLQHKDFMHHRASGMEQVIAKIAAEKGVIIGFSCADVLACEGRRRAQLIGRIAQNIRLCTKYGARMFFGSFAREPCQMRRKEDTKRFFLSL